jgi:regulator of protease activity HflC (stomatin/prohibitin superfamily)
MFDKLIDFFISTIEKTIPILILDETKAGVMFRGGRFRKELKAGVTFKIPFYDTWYETSICATTLNIGAQSLTTKDNISVVISGVIKFYVENPIIFLTKVENAKDALSDMVSGIIFNFVRENTFEEIKAKIVDRRIIYGQIKSEAAKWGIAVLDITFKDFSQTQSVRLIQDYCHDIIKE